MRGKTTIILCMGLLVSLVNLSIAQEKKEVTCTGKVVNEESKPITDVKVTLYEMVYDETTLTFDCNMLEHVNTKADGAFSFNKSIENESYRYGYIVAEKEG